MYRLTVATILAVMWSMAACDTGSLGTTDGDGGADSDDSPGVKDGGIDPESDGNGEMGTSAEDVSSAESDDVDLEGRLNDICCIHDPVEPCGLKDDFCMPPGGFCGQPEHCQSTRCDTWSGFPPDPEAQCLEADGKYHVKGTAFDIETNEIVAGAAVEFASGVGTSAVGCDYPADFTATTDDKGRLYVVRDEVPTDGLGFVARSYKEDAGYTVKSVKGVADAPYFGSLRMGNFLMVKTASLEKWSKLLENDEGMKPSLPLGTTGGVVGRVIDVDTGQLIAGAVIKSSIENSRAQVRYLNEDGNGFNEKETSSRGIFIIARTALKESFHAWLGEERATQDVVGVAERSGCIFLVEALVAGDDLGLWEPCRPCD